jgi:hypothetical protein
MRRSTFCGQRLRALSVRCKDPAQAPTTFSCAGSAANDVRHSEALYEDDSFPERELAALVAAKVYYQLQEYNESMVFALGAGKLFDIHKAAEFEETIMGKTTQTLGTAAPAQHHAMFQIGFST